MNLIIDDREIDVKSPEQVYSVAHFVYGIAIRGELPPLIEGHLSQLFQLLYGYDTFDALIADELSAVIVLTTVEKSKKWRAILEINIRED